MSRRVLILGISILSLVCLPRPGAASTIVLDFEDRPDNFANGIFPVSYHAVTWTAGNWLEYAPYIGYAPDGINAIFAAIDGASFTFAPQVFDGAAFSAPLLFDPRFVSRVYFELYNNHILVHTSVDLNSGLFTFLASGYGGLVDEVRVRTVANGGTVGSLMTVGGSAWIMDDVTFRTDAVGGAPVPEPATLSLLAIGLGAGWRARRGVKRER